MLGKLEVAARIIVAVSDILRGIFLMCLMRGDWL